MSPRSRTTTDAEVLEGAARALSRLGPGRLTLAEVAGEVGLSPATLVQRFGSKRGLLLALARWGAGGVREQYESLRAAHPSPLAALRALPASLAALTPTPEALANHLAFLQMDLSDPELHQLALEHSRATREQLRALLEAAVAAGELVPCDTARLASTVQAVLDGARLSWALYREGPVADWVLADLETLVGPLLARPAAARKHPRR